MSEFEKELLDKVSPHDRTHNGNELFLGGVLAEHFKDWQPPKPLVVVPQFVAEWFEEKMSVTFSEVVSAYSFSDNEAITWVYNNGGIGLLCKMKLYGYTVEKEPLFYLKNKITQEYLYDNDGHFSECGKEALGFDMFKVEFTKSEIEDMETGSYEKIEVEQ